MSDTPHPITEHMDQFYSREHEIFVCPTEEVEWLEDLLIAEKDRTAMKTEQLMRALDLCESLANQLKK